MTQENDHPLEWIRQVRHKISAECGHDPYKMVERLMRLQERHADRLIDPPAQEQRDPSALAAPGSVPPLGGSNEPTG